MADFTKDITAEVLAACKAGAEEAAEALGRGLDAPLKMMPGEVAELNLAELPDGFDGPGLAVVLKIGEVAALALLPESSGLLPEWYAEPDATGESKLATLAQELSMLLIPEDFIAEEFHAGKVERLSEALERGEVSDGAGFIPLALAADERQGTLNLIWPAAAPDAVIPDAVAEDAADEEAEAPATEPDGPAEPVAPAAPLAPADAPAPTLRVSQGFEQELRRLPRYTRSMLRIEVPMVVTLASKKQSINEILELGPGSIIKFEKSCDEMLELEIGGQTVAEGEAVKVGDKFGLRVNAMILPSERFRKVRPTDA